MYIDNCSNCWKPLRVIFTTTQFEKINVNVKKNMNWAISSEAPNIIGERSTTIRKE